MNRPFGFLVLFIALYSCAHNATKTDSLGRPLRKEEVLIDQIEGAKDLIVTGDRKFVVCSDPKGLIQYTSGKIENLGTVEKLGAIAFDERRMQFYIQNGNEIQIVKAKDPKSVVGKIPLSEGVTIRDIVYSLMNRRAYFTDSQRPFIWEVNPIKLTLQQLPGSETLEELGKGLPEDLWPSTDGTRIYVTMNGASGASIVRFSLRDKKAEILKTMEGNRAVGIDMIKNHLVVALEKAPFLVGLDLRRKEWIEFKVPEGLLSQPKKMRLDQTIAIVLDQKNQIFQAVQVLLQFKD